MNDPVVDVEVVVKATIKTVVATDGEIHIKDAEELIAKYGANILSSPVVLFVTKAEK